MLVSYVSGPKAAVVAQTILGKVPKPRYADYLPFRNEDNSVLDQGLSPFSSLILTLLRVKMF